MVNSVFKSKIVGQKIDSNGGSFSFSSYISFFKIYFILISERGKSRERERERHQSVDSHTYPDWGANLQPKHVRNRTGDLSVCGMRLQTTEHTGKGSSYISCLVLTCLLPFPLLKNIFIILQ